MPNIFLYYHTRIPLSILPVILLQKVLEEYATKNSFLPKGFAFKASSFAEKIGDY